MTTAKAVTASQSAEIEVVLAKPHTHKGESFAVGKKIKVTADQAAWLSKQGVVVGKDEGVRHG